MKPAKQKSITSAAVENIKPALTLKHPNLNEGAQAYRVRTFAPFLPEGPSANEIKETLLLGEIECGYIPFNQPAIRMLSELHKAALGKQCESEQGPVIPANEAPEVRKLRMKLQKKQAQLADAEQGFAAFNLFDAVSWGIEMIDDLSRRRPEMMRKIAESQTGWPVLASHEVDWLEINEKLKSLKLGQGKTVRKTDPPFHPAQGDEAQLPARIWAKAAVRCLAQTKDRQKRLAAGLLERLRQWRMTVKAEPAWAKKTIRLPDFSADKNVLRLWARIIREMIREQIPDFHNRSEWLKHRSLNSRVHTRTSNDIVTKGVAQNAILDDIIAALKFIAPRRPDKEPT